ncbi:5852_t:CDS:2 [Cetraspora pellucida]|uniref:5852_t:CDS:1 n=1 Tax=Cetraspora pellucida TaxID=1433469 RepID=A0ACA9PKY6_9GLOM|nr:5852_t:CDS:2 [Cetraspora pellucida]
MDDLIDKNPQNNKTGQGIKEKSPNQPDQPRPNQNDNSAKITQLQQEINSLKQEVQNLKNFTDSPNSDLLLAAVVIVALVAWLIPEGRGIIHCKFSFNNTILSLSKENGDILATVSAGSVDLGNNKKVTGTKKGTPFMATKVVEKIIRKAKEFGIHVVIVKAKKLGSSRDTVIREILEEKSLNVEALIDQTPVRHGGCRPPRAPRK